MGLTCVPLSHSCGLCPFISADPLTHTFNTHSSSPAFNVTPFFFSSPLQIHTSRCAGRGRMWGKPKTELCLFLTQRYAIFITVMMDFMCACNPLLLSCSSSPSPGVQLDQMYFTSALPLPDRQIALSSVVQLGTQPHRIVTSHPKLCRGLRSVHRGLRCHGNTRNHIPDDCAVAPPGGRQSFMHFEQPHKTEQHVIWAQFVAFHMVLSRERSF